MTQKDILIKKTEEYLKSQNWNYALDGDVFSLSFRINCKLQRCQVRIYVYEDGILCYGYCPLNATKDVYETVAEYITRANYGYKLGAFEMDYQDGEIRIRTFLSVLEGVPSIKDIERVVDICHLRMQKYGNGLAKALMGFGDPARDIEEAEA